MNQQSIIQDQNASAAMNSCQQSWKGYDGRRTKQNRGFNRIRGLHVNTGPETCFLEKAAESRLAKLSD